MPQLRRMKFLVIADPGTIDEQPHWYWLQDNSGGLASLPLASNQGSDQANGKPGNIISLTLNPSVQSNFVPLCPGRGAIASEQHDESEHVFRLNGSRVVWMSRRRLHYSVKTEHNHSCYSVLLLSSSTLYIYLFP